MELAQLFFSALIAKKRLTVKGWCGLFADGIGEPDVFFADSVVVTRKQSGRGYMCNTSRLSGLLVLLTPRENSHSSCMSVNGGFEFLLLCGGDAFEAAGCSAGDYLGVFLSYAAELGALVAVAARYWLVRAVQVFIHSHDDGFCAGDGVHCLFLRGLVAKIFSQSPSLADYC